MKEFYTVKIRTLQNEEFVWQEKCTIKHVVNIQQVIAFLENRAANNARGWSSALDGAIESICINREKFNKKQRSEKAA